MTCLPKSTTGPRDTTTQGGSRSVLAIEFVLVLVATQFARVREASRWWGISASSRMMWRGRYARTSSRLLLLLLLLLLVLELVLDYYCYCYYY